MKLNFEKIYEEFEGRVPCVKGCSKCCVNAEFIVLLPSEREHICSKIHGASKHIITKSIDGQKIDLIQQPCPFLEDGLCSIEENRPFDCRSFPIDYCIFEDEIVTFTSKNCPTLNKMSKRDVEKISKHIIDTISQLDKKWIIAANKCGPCGNCEYRNDCNAEPVFYDENW
jgi:Fe-S-cluster containining protein